MHIFADAKPFFIFSNQFATDSVARIQIQEGKKLQERHNHWFCKTNFSLKCIEWGKGGLSNSSGMSVCHEQQFINRNNFDQCQSIRFDRYQTYQIELLRFIDV